MHETTRARGENILYDVVSAIRDGILRCWGAQKELFILVLGEIITREMRQFCVCVFVSVLFGV